MNTDYSTYELNSREKWSFLIIGYSAIFAAVYLFFRSPLVSALFGGCIYFLLPHYSSRLAKSRRNKLKDQFRDLLLVMSASIESGRHMEEAIIESGERMSAMYEDDSPIMQELALMKKSIVENNDSDVALLSDFAARSDCEDIRNFVDVYLTCRNTGGDVGSIISHTTRIMSEKMEISAQIAVLTAQKKLEGRIISSMPLAMLLVMNLLSPAYIDVLYTTFAGRVVMCICLLGICVGIRLMERLTEF